jgi:BlaI family transcriptional regulator, penicillinase repressor
MSSRTPASREVQKTPSISEAEWIVMREFWARGETTSSEVIAALGKTQDWKPPTIMTLITRLVKKGALGFERQGREYLYRPLVDEAHCAHAVSKSLVDRVFGGRVAPMLACFLDRQKLSKKDIAELRELLDAEPK